MTIAIRMVSSFLQRTGVLFEWLYCRGYRAVDPEQADRREPLTPPLSNQRGIRLPQAHRLVAAYAQDAGPFEGRLSMVLQVEE